MTTPAETPVPPARVTALLVSHEGARWLPAVLDGLVAQTRAPDRVVAVDTGSTDDSAALVARATGAAVVPAPATAGYGEAVALGLGSAAPPDDDGADGEADDWVWLLHDDSAPAPDALAQLLAAAEANPSADLLGPKLREWPSLRRLLEVGVTISGTGRRETGLERGEYDQGQHDRVRDVLAVHTAGLLVRRRVLDALGFDPRLPLFGNDLDLGWRAARAGHRTIVVPDAVVFHVEAAHRGVRPGVTIPGLPGRSFRRGERAAALYTLLVSCSLVVLPFQAVRLLLGSLLRALGLLLVRAPGEARDELVALASVYARPDRIVAGRRARRRTATVRPREVRHLLAPAWMPYRHGLDFVSDLASALVHQASDVSATRRASRPSRRSGSGESLQSSETGPVPVEAQNLPEDAGLLARFVLSPVAWVFTALVVAAVVAARGLLGTGSLAGGALLPAPAGALDWWGRYLESWHDLGIGSGAPAAPYLVPLAAVGTLLLGKAWLVVDLLFLLAVPLAAFGAYRFLARVTGSLPMTLWGAAAYGVLPVVSGAVQQGRLGTVAGAVVLPWLAHAALFLSDRHDADRRTRAAWRCALWLALLAAFVPVAWFVALLVTLAGVAVRLRRGRRDVLAPLVPLLATLVLLLPWTLAVWTHQGVAGVLFEAGLPAPDLTDPLTRWDVLTGRPGAGAGAGAPGWFSLGVLLAAVAALARPDTRRAVTRAWAVLLAALVVVAVLAPVRTSLPASPVDQPLWLGFPLLVAQAAAIVAAAIAGAGIRSRLTGSSFSWRQPVGLLVVLLAAVTPVVSVLWWAWSGSGDPLDRRSPARAPAYMTDAAAADPVRGVLVVRGSRATGFDYELLRQPGLRLGDDTALPSAADQARLTTYVQHLAGAPQPQDVAGLARLGVAYVYVPPPADVGLVGNLDSVSGVTPGSAVAPGARAWQVEATPSRADLPAPDERSRPWLLALQGLGLLAVAVLAAPSRQERR